ncbi:universal stress protein [Aquimarina sp. U1-2]|uniref:universal stress protein n=1 Tax=Aquimarina sp. U1-2 TaxID=2823141 RepID=UPI001AEC919D|nr:universal stress protein [Aquimarina sp. U1-2]MBP2831491.1 universal stress protein [Aquimarina sp. U1-2]
MKRILLPTDFSENAFNAIRYAMHFFKNNTTTFYILNTFTPVSYHAGYLIENPTMYGLEDVAMMNSKKELERTEEKIKNEFDNPKHTFKKLASFNTLVGEIKVAVEKYAIDLIVMGTKGATGAKEVFIGTHTMYTIKKVKIPVLAIPSGYEFEEPLDVLFPTDYKLSKNNTYLSLIKEICDAYTSRLNILNAYYGIPLRDTQKEIKEFLSDYFKENTAIFHIEEEVDVIEALEEFRKKYKVNLLIMIHNQHSFFENLLFRPVIHQIAYHTNIPFLVIPSVKN